MNIFEYMNPQTSFYILIKNIEKDIYIKKIPGTDISPTHASQKTKTENKRKRERK